MSKTDKKSEVYQLPNGKWKHIKSKIEWTDKEGAQTDLRFCKEWEK